MSDRSGAAFGPVPLVRPVVFTWKMYCWGPVLVMFQMYAGPKDESWPAGIPEMRSAMAAKSSLSRMPNAVTVGKRTLTCRSQFLSLQ